MVHADFRQFFNRSAEWASVIFLALFESDKPERCRREKGKIFLRSKTPPVEKTPQYLVNTTRMTRDIQTHPDRYAGRLLQPDNTDDTDLGLKCFHRVLPQLIDEEDDGAFRFFHKSF